MTKPSSLSEETDVVNIPKSTVTKKRMKTIVVTKERRRRRRRSRTRGTKRV